ncbi:MAG: hypothetical protein WAN50_00165 [Minisyncoccia bacterium]
MSKKDFIALADAIKEHNRTSIQANHFQPAHLATLASFCKGVNYNFMQSRWLDYIAGQCGPNGGTPKK